MKPTITLRPAVASDADLLARWDKEPHVISATTDDPDAERAFDGACWPDEIAMQSPVFQYYIAELDGRPIGTTLIIDPHLEPTHYWGEIQPGLRAVDIWIGEADALGKGHGTEIMRLALAHCFADANVYTVLIDPLASNTRVHRFYERLGFKPLERRILPPADDCLVHTLTRQDWRNQFTDTLAMER